MSRPRTRAGALAELVPGARHVVEPSGITSTAWPSVRDTCRNLGVEFDPWQDGAGRLILAKRADGSYACSIGGVVISIPRQVGKTFLVGAIVFALCLLRPGLTVIWTAHHTATANETFASMQGFARRRKIAPHVAKVLIDDMTVLFVNGSRVMFGARERGFGRGFTDVAVLVFDEAQILSERAMSDMIPAQNTAVNPLLLLMGTPPKEADNSEVFSGRRSDALSGDGDDMGYIEFSADADADPEDRKQWRKANPSYPGRTPESAILRMKKNLTPESFLLEALGIWRSDVVTASAVDVEQWADLAGQEDHRPSPVAFAVEVSPDRRWSTICLAGWRSDGDRHVQVVDVGRGTEWVPGRLSALAEEWKPVATAINPRGPAGSLIADIDANATKLHKLTATELGQACSMMADGIDAGTIHHPGQPLLTRAASALAHKRSGESWVWRPLDSTDISPFQAATWALFGLATKPRTRKPTRVVVMR